MREPAGKGAFVVVGDDLRDQLGDRGGLGHRIEPTPTDEFANVILDLVHPTGDRHASPR